MDDAARQALCRLVAQYGRHVADDVRRCEGLIRDFCPARRREANLLISALKERVPADLLASSDGVPKSAVLARLARRLHENLGLDEGFARWAVESWALALGATSTDTLTRASASKPTTEVSGRNVADATAQRSEPLGLGRAAETTLKRLYVGNLAYVVREEDLQEAFSPVGQCESINVIRDRATGQSRGFGFVVMSSDKEAQHLIHQLDGMDIRGRAITVSEARERDGGGGQRWGSSGGGRGDRSRHQASLVEPGSIRATMRQQRDSAVCAACGEAHPGGGPSTIACTYSIAPSRPSAAGGARPQLYQSAGGTPANASRCSRCGQRFRWKGMCPKCGSWKYWCGSLDRAPRCHTLLINCHSVDGLGGTAVCDHCLMQARAGSSTATPVGTGAI